MAQPALELRRALAVALALLIAVPAAPLAALPVTAAQAALPRIPLTLTTASGRHRYSVEVAASPDQQAMGLMFRTAMRRDRGMIFPMAPPRRASFWMENTVLPLDLVFIGADGRVRNIRPGVPYSRDFILSDGAVAAVLELNLGEAARIGLRPGDAVVYRLAR